MTPYEIQLEAERVVDAAVRAQIDLHLTEYRKEESYREHYPDGRSIEDHNAVVRAVMREAKRRGLQCTRRFIE